MQLRTLQEFNPFESLQTRLHIKINSDSILAAIVILAVCITGFSIVQYATPGLAGNDGYYHMKMGYLIRTQGLTPDFPYLPFTILNESAYYDHHMLYHAYLAIFALVDPAVDGGISLTHGAKFASILMPSFAFLAIWWLLRNQNVPYASVWTLGLFVVSEPFLYRMSMPRAQSMSLLLLALGLHWLLTEKHRYLLPLGFVFVWAYNAFPLLLVLGGVYVIATLMLERRLAWTAVFYPAIGIGLGLLINPYFPENIDFILGHLAPKLGESSTRVGNEWSPYRTWTLVENSAGTFVLFLAGVLALGWHKERIAKPTLVALGTAVLFGYMLFESRRFIEYFPPFVLIFFALSITPLLHEWLNSEWGQRPLIKAIIPVGLTLLLAYPLYISLSDSRELMQRSKDANHYADATLWLQRNTPQGTQIFQTDWDDFTRLFFYNSDAIYTAGLDPTFMELEDKELFDLWVDVTRGRVENPSQIIKEQFGGDYVFSDLNHESFMEDAEDDPNLEEVYRDEFAVIYQVLE